MRKTVLQTLLLSVMLLVLAFAMPLSAQAAEEDYSLTVEFITENGPVPGSEVKIYRVLDDAEELTGAFADLDVEVGDLTDSGAVDALCDALADSLDEVAPDAVGTTDVSGKVLFEDMESGIYLVVGSPVTVDNVRYTPKSAFVRVPYLVAEDGLVTDVVIRVKYDYYEIPIETIERSVVKVWDDNNNPSRPSVVIVELLKDGAVFDTVVLSERSDWRHTWTDLDASADWQVRETNVPEEYKAQITLEGTVFTVTNTLKTGTSSGDSTPGTDEKLPQTGQLWWPVPILFCAGMGLLLTGIVTATLNHDEEE